MAGIWDFLKGTTPASRGANYAGIFHTSAGPGYNTPIALAAIDESGNVANLAHFAVLDYRLLKISWKIDASGTWTPANGCRAIYVELWGGGGAGGGMATSSSSSSMGAGGGGGGYSASWITGITTTIAYVCGAGGTAGGAGASGNNGADTTWNTTTVVAKGGTGGAVLAAGTSFLRIVGGAGGVAGTGDISIAGGIGGTGIRLSASQAWSGGGGIPPMLGSVSAQPVVAIAGGTAGENSGAANYGAGGGGGATITTAGIGGTGTRGAIRIWEFS